MVIAVGLSRLIDNAEINLADSDLNPANVETYLEPFIMRIRLFPKSLTYKLSLASDTMP